MMDNLTLSDHFLQVQEKCLQMCRYPQCDYDFSVTQLITSYVGINYFTFRLELPRSFSYYVRLQPSMYFVDYVTMVMSCFGTWLGVSVLSINPQQAWHWVSKYNRQTRDTLQSSSSERRLNRMALAKDSDMKALQHQMNQVLTDLQNCKRTIARLQLSQ